MSRWAWAEIDHDAIRRQSGERNGAGDPFREGVRAVTGILGAFKDAIEQTFDDLSTRGGVEGAAFFVQERIGQHRRHFRLYKLRTMVADKRGDAHASGNSTHTLLPFFSARSPRRALSI